MSRVARGVSGSAALSLLRALATLVLTPLYFAHLEGPARGGWMLFAGLGGWVLIWDLGLAIIASRAFAYHAGSREGKRALPPELGPELGAAAPGDLRRTLAAAYGLLAAALALAGVVGGWLYLGTLDLGGALQELRLAWILYALGLAVVLGGSLPNYLLQGAGDLGLEAMLQAGALAFNVAASAACLWMGMGPLALAACFLGQALLARLLAAALARRRHPWAFEGGAYRPALLRELLGQAGPLLLTRLGALAVFQATPLMIASLLGPERIPAWAATQTLAMYGGQFLLALPQGLGPWIAAERAKGGEAGLVPALLLTLKAGSALALAWAVACAFFGPGLMTLWLGEAGVGEAGLLALLALLYAAEFHLQVLAQFVFSGGKWPFAAPALAAGALNLGLAWFLIPRHGLLGAALALVGAQMLVSQAWSLKVARDLLGLEPGRWLREVALPLGLLGAALAGAAFALRGVLEGIPRLSLSLGRRDLGQALPELTGFVLVGLLGACLALAFLMSPEERRRLAALRRRA